MRFALFLALLSCSAFAQGIAPPSTGGATVTTASPLKGDGSAGAPVTTDSTKALSGTGVTATSAPVSTVALASGGCFSLNGVPGACNSGAGVTTLFWDGTDINFFAGTATLAKLNAGTGIMTENYGVISLGTGTPNFCFDATCAWYIKKNSLDLDIVTAGNNPIKFVNATGQVTFPYGLNAGTNTGGTPFSVSTSGIAVGTNGDLIAQINVGAITLSSGSGTATVKSGAKCFCQETNSVLAAKCAVSGTTLTATVTGGTTDVVNYVCF